MVLFKGSYKFQKEQLKEKNVYTLTLSDIADTLVF